MVESILKLDAACALHYIVKSLVAKCAMEFGYACVSEDKGYPAGDKTFTPDIVLRYKGKERDRKRTVLVEVERTITPKWLEQHQEAYKHNDWFVVPLKKLTGGGYRNIFKSTSELTTEVRRFVDMGTEKPIEVRAVHTSRVKKTKPEKVRKECDWCTKKVIDLWRHQKQCKKNPDNRPSDDLV